LAQCRFAARAKTVMENCCLSATTGVAVAVAFFDNLPLQLSKPEQRDG
jgi:hypothetical protein